MTRADFYIMVNGDLMIVRPQTTRAKRLAKEFMMWRGAYLDDARRLLMPSYYWNQVQHKILIEHMSLGLY